jgi:hypothetical protein
VNKTPYEQLYHAVQATFLAAVQSQILALSFQDNLTSLKITTNTFGFVGILLDVITACLDLLGSTILQRHIAAIEQQLDAIEDASSEQLIEISHFIKQSLQLLRAAEMFPDIYRCVQAKMEARSIVLRRAEESADVNRMLFGRKQRSFGGERKPHKRLEQLQRDLRRITS